MKIKKQILVVFFILSALFAFGQSAGDYRAVGTNTWATVAIWQTYSGGAWIAAATAPNNTSGVITIQSPYTVTISASLNIDQVVVDPGATLICSAGALTISNGVGVDLQVNGTFIDASNTAMPGWGLAGPTWALGVNGSYVKRSSNSSNNWRDRYDTGISNIPATANWTIEKKSATNPVLTTVGAMYYPNLTIINNFGGSWSTTVSSTFNGSADYPRIKGDFTIGSAAAAGTVDFLSNCTNATPISVGGNFSVAAGNTLRNYGTGMNIQGNATVDGTVNYSAGGIIIFSGNNAQSVNGAGTFNIYNMTMSKGLNSLTLNRALKIDNILTLSSGIIYSTATNLLTINTFGSVASASNSSFVDGPVRYIGFNAFTYPVGKGTDYQALSTSAVNPYPYFWTETFSNGCSSNCSATTYVGANGAWSVTSTGTNDSDNNRWYVSGAECGNAAGGCGTSCGGTDPSLHIGSNASVLGDGGASYLAGGLGLWFVRTDLRAESPTIDCSGKSTITLSFNYIENGQGSTDNATLWYFDGTTWAQLFDLSKTALCGAQGTWTNFSISLPATADNNPSVKIGFEWVNNDDNVGVDPSIAVDDIVLNTPVPVIDFTAEYFYNDPQSVFNNSLIAGIDHISNCEYWTLTRNAGTENKKVTLTWDGNSCGITAAADELVAHWDGAVWQNEGNTAYSGSAAAGTVTSGIVTWFSPFTTGSVNAMPLPIELLSFTAKYNEPDVDLKWETASETNNDYFTVERSADALNFEEVGTVKGAGNSSEVLHYFLPDHSPLIDESYYRLKQTDFDGAFKYSDIVAVNIEDIDFSLITYAVTENGDELEVNIDCNNDCFINFELFDMTGKRVYTGKNDMERKESKIMIPLNNLSRGIYLLKAYNENKVISKKIRL